MRDDRDAEAAKAAAVRARWQKGGYWVVANVYLDTDRYNDLVTCAVAFRGFKAAKEEARRKAQGLLDTFNEDARWHGWKELAFDEAWAEVDRSDGIESEYGFDPVDSKVSCAAIRVFHAEKGDKAR